MNAPTHPIAFETASQLNPGAIMFVNRQVSTEYLKHYGLMHGDVKVGVRVPNWQGVGPRRVWQTIDDETRIRISRSCVCLVTALYIQEEPGVMADLICFQRANGEYQTVLLEKVNLTYENTYYVFFDITKYTFNFNREIEYTAHGEVKRLHAGSDDIDLDVNDCDQVVDFFASVVYVEEHNNRHVGGIDDYEYEAWNSDTACTEILLPTESSAQLALQSECVLKTSKFDDYAQINIPRSRYNQLRTSESRELELTQQVSELQTQVNEFYRAISDCASAYDQKVSELRTVTIKYERAKSECDKLQEKISHFGGRLFNLLDENERWQEKHTELKADNAELKIWQHKINEDHAKLKQLYDEATRKPSTQSTSTQTTENQFECVFNTSKFDDHAYKSVRRSEWNALQAGRNRQMELEEDVSDLQVQVNELSRKLHTYEAEYEITVKELHESKERIRRDDQLLDDYKAQTSNLKQQISIWKQLNSELKAQLNKTAQTQGTQTTTQNQYRVDQIFTDTI